VKKLLVLLILIGVGIALATFWTSGYWRNGEEDHFTTIPVEWGSITEIINANGIVKPRTVVPVGSELSGRVVQLYPGADFNKHVQKDQPLARLDDRLAAYKLDQAKVASRLADADVKRAEAARDAAQSGLERVKVLLEQGLGPKKEDVERADLQLRSAEAAVTAAKVKVEEAEVARKQAQLGLDLTIIKAPQAGVIVERKVVEGQLIAPPSSGQLFTIASDLDQMEVLAQIAEGDIGRVEKGLVGKFTVYSLGDDEKPFQGAINDIWLQPTNVQGAVFYTAVIGEVKNRPGDGKGAPWILLPGMTATVDIERRQHVGVWKLPTTVLHFQLDEHYQSPAAKARLVNWPKDRRDADAWRPVWMMQNKEPWPIFVRVGGTNKKGETGIKTADFEEILEWDPDLQPPPDSNQPEAYPKLINGAPEKKPGIFDQAKLKLS
jgi:HlyD family secretion protein